MNRYWIMTLKFPKSLGSTESFGAQLIHHVHRKPLYFSKIWSTMYGGFISPNPMWWTRDPGFPWYSPVCLTNSQLGCKQTHDWRNYKDEFKLPQGLYTTQSPSINIYIYLGNHCQEHHMACSCQENGRYPWISQKRYLVLNQNYVLCSFSSNT